MYCRKAVPSDLPYLMRAIPQKHIDYIRAQVVKDDVLNGRVYLCVEHEKPVSMIALVWMENYQRFYLKRSMTFKKKNQGKGYNAEVLRFVCEMNCDKPLAITPWVNNATMRHLVEKNGFSLEKIFNEHWCFYTKNP